jgi:hypothetical protein
MLARKVACRSPQVVTSPDFDENPQAKRRPSLQQGGSMRTLMLGLALFAAQEEPRTYTVTLEIAVDTH